MHLTFSDWNLVAGSHAPPRFKKQSIIQVHAGLDGLCKAPVSEFDVFRVQFNPDVLTAMLNRHNASRCGPRERIEYDSAFRTPSQQAGSRQVGREYCEMGTTFERFVGIVQTERLLRPVGFSRSATTDVPLPWAEGSLIASPS